MKLRPARAALPSWLPALTRRFMLDNFFLIKTNHSSTILISSFLSKKWSEDTENSDRTHGAEGSTIKCREDAPERCSLCLPPSFAACASSRSLLHLPCVCARLSVSVWSAPILSLYLSLHVYAHIYTSVSLPLCLISLRCTFTLTGFRTTAY